MKKKAIRFGRKPVQESEPLPNLQEERLLKNLQYYNQAIQNQEKPSQEANPQQQNPIIKKNREERQGKDFQRLKKPQKEEKEQMKLTFDIPKQMGYHHTIKTIQNRFVALFSMKQPFIDPVEMFQNENVHRVLGSKKKIPTPHKKQSKQKEKLINLKEIGQSAYNQHYNYAQEDDRFNLEGQFGEVKQFYLPSHINPPHYPKILKQHSIFNMEDDEDGPNYLNLVCQNHSNNRATQSSARPDELQSFPIFPQWNRTQTFPVKQQEDEQFQIQSYYPYGKHGFY